MSSMREAQHERARDYILAHPDESKSQQAQATGLSPRTIATVRAELVAAGKLRPNRRVVGKPVKATKVMSPPAPAPASSGEQTDQAASPQLLDHEAMLALADMDDIDSLDDAETHKRLLKQALRFAFNPKLHPDTRMSASQMWSKLRDQARAKDLGPGAPLTLEDAVARMLDMHTAAGVRVVLGAILAAPTDFRIKLLTALVDAVESDANEGQVPADANTAAPSPAGPALTN